MRKKQPNQPKPFPAEDAVVAAVRAWLTCDGNSFEQRDDVDLVVRDGNTGRLWVVEAKGKTSQSGLDFRTGLGQILTAMRDDGSVYAVAIPAIPAYRRLCGGISDHVRRVLGLHWLLVGKDRQVWLVKPDAPLPDVAFADEHG
jgi:hypothetical protein